MSGLRDESVIAEALKRMGAHPDLAHTVQDADDRLVSLSLRLQNAETDFATLRNWVADHLAALPHELTDDSDDEDVFSSLRYVIDGEPGCTEEDDYPPEQWRVLQRCAALASSVEREPVGDQAVVAAAKACLDQWAQGRGNPPRLMSVERRLADLTGWFYSDPLDPYFGPRSAEREPESETA